MKKFFSIILILIIVLGIWYIYKQRSPVSAPDQTTNISKPDPVNATFIFEDGPITLKNGLHQEIIALENELTQDTTLVDTVEYGDINRDKKNDAVAVLVQSGGGSGVFVYLGAYVSGPLDYKGTNAVFVGDRIEPKSISIDSGVITFKYLGRRLDEPYAAEPTVLTTKQFVYTKGALVEK